MEAGRRLASGPFVTSHYLRRGSGGEIRRQGFLGIDILVYSPFGRVLLQNIFLASTEKVSCVAVKVPRKLAQIGKA